MGKRPYSVIRSFFVVAEDFWPSLTARYYQIDLLDLPWLKLLDLIHGWLKEVLSQDDFDKLMIQFEAPLPGSERKISDASAEQEGAEFMAAMRTLQRG